MAAGGPGDSLLASTADGIFNVNPSDMEGAAERLPTPSGWITTSLAYNAQTGNFYSSSVGGQIKCFSRLLW